MSSGINRRTLIAGWLPGLIRKPAAQLSGVPFKVIRYGHSPRRFIVIHGDETTARDVLSAYMFDHEGVAFIVQGTRRNLEVAGLKIDPNRMFSRVGAEKSLLRLNPGAGADQIEATLNDLGRERRKTLRQLVPPKGSRLFALHNNRGYSVRDEIAASDEISLKQPDMPNNFFLCTSPADFAILQQSPFNVVLQSKPDPDDGSLSRLAARQGFRYINLECALGDFEGQLLRLRWLEDRLP